MPGSRRRSIRLGLGALLLGLLLGACSLYSPPRNHVVVVRQVDAASGPPATLPGVAQPPTTGLNALAVAQGFMLAMSAGPSSLAARWTTGSRSGLATIAGWPHRSSTGVYSAFTVGGPVLQGGGATVPVTVQLVGTFAAGQWSPANAALTLPLGLRRVGGEWRVADPPAVPLVSLADFDSRWTRCAAYFVPPDGRHVTPSPVFVPVASLQGTICAPGTAGALAALAAGTLRAMLAGPTGLARASLRTAIPTGTRLNALSLVNQVAHVDLSAPFARQAGAPGTLRVAQVVWTVTQVVQTAQVLITVDGRPATAIGPDRFDAAGPLLRTSPTIASLGVTRGGSPSVVLFVRSPPGQIYRVNLNALGERPTRVAFGVGGNEADPAWAPGGTLVAFLDGQGSGTPTLRIGSVASGHSVPAGLAGDLSPPTWLPGDAGVLELVRADGTEQLAEAQLAGSGQVAGLRLLTLAPLPGGLAPTELRVSPDGGFVLAVAAPARAPFGSGGALYLGALTARGVVAWSGPIAPGLGTEFSPVWVDPSLVAFVAHPVSPGATGQLWTETTDGWQQSQVGLSAAQGLQVGDRLAVDPAGDRLVFTVPSASGQSLDAVTRFGGALEPVTTPAPVNGSADDAPAIASG